MVPFGENIKEAEERLTSSSAVFPPTHPRRLTASITKTSHILLITCEYTQVESGILHEDIHYLSRSNRLGELLAVIKLPIVTFLIEDNSYIHDI